MPSKARAVATLPSSPPRCTPSADTCAASFASSLTINVRRIARQVAQGRGLLHLQSQRPQLLLRYCKTRAPPCKARRTAQQQFICDRWIVRRTAYKPLNARGSCWGGGHSGCWADFIRPVPPSYFIARPEQTVRDMLSHAGPEAVFQGLPGVFLRFIHGFWHDSPFANSAAIAAASVQPEP